MELDDFLVTALLGCVSLTGPQLRPPGHPQPWPRPFALRAIPCCLCGTGVTLGSLPSSFLRTGRKLLRECKRTLKGDYLGGAMIPKLSEDPIAPFPLSCSLGFSSPWPSPVLPRLASRTVLCHTQDRPGPGPPQPWHALVCPGTPTALAHPQPCTPWHTHSPGLPRTSASASME